MIAGTRRNVTFICALPVLFHFTIYPSCVLDKQNRSAFCLTLQLMFSTESTPILVLKPLDNEEIRVNNCFSGKRIDLARYTYSLFLRTDIMHSGGTEKYNEKYHESMIRTQTGQQIV